MNYFQWIVCTDILAQYHPVHVTACLVSLSLSRLMIPRITVICGSCMARPGWKWATRTWNYTALNFRISQLWEIWAISTRLAESSYKLIILKKTKIIYLS